MALGDFPNVIRLNGSNYDSKTSRFGGVVYLQMLLSRSIFHVMLLASKLEAWAWAAWAAWVNDLRAETNTTNHVTNQLEYLLVRRGAVHSR